MLRKIGAGDGQIFYDLGKNGISSQFVNVIIAFSICLCTALSGIFKSDYLCNHYNIRSILSFFIFAFYPLCLILFCWSAFIYLYIYIFNLHFLLYFLYLYFFLYFSSFLYLSFIIFLSFFVFLFFFLLVFFWIFL